MLLFEHAFWFLLLPLPWLVARFWPRYRERRSSVRLPFLERLARLTGQAAQVPTQATEVPRMQLALNALVWVLVVLALARPQWLEAPLTRTEPARDLLVALDLSGSMETEDFTDADGNRVDRLSAVKGVVADFLARRADDRIALIVFGSAAFVQLPFTADTAVVQQMLDETSVRMAGPRTMLGDAIGLAITLFERSALDERLMILLTDGNDTGSQVPPARAASIARDNNIRIHTIGVGDPTHAGEDPLDEQALRAVATTTGGQYFHAADRQALESIYRQLDELTPRIVDTLSYRPRRELFYWPLGAAVLLSLLYHGIGALAGRVVGRSGPSSAGVSP